ncbi:disease resistance RPP13-like protein 4 [Triticum urartu]|uniref:Disease resistance protein RGA3 n=2 Tax=Triticum urartu TaxID=4572 RepID=A0A8R7VHH7_TRIUA|nr:disease resistance RPP13-like protein 4 [Triticum urartu]
MAMILNALASNVLNMLMEVGKEEVSLLLGVSGEINRMRVRLQDLRNFLTDADRRRITDNSVQGWVTELKGVMYEATDILDLCQLKAMEQSPLASQKGCFNQLFSCLRSPLFTHDISSRIKVLNQRLDNIKERSAAFSFINLGSYDDHGGKVHASLVASPSRETSGELDRSGVVGEKIEQDTRKLVEIMLTGIKGGTSHGDGKVMVFAIVGVGGIGKTTLAQKVFNDEAIQSEFDKTIWVSINQDLNEAELLKRAIIEAGGDHSHAGNAKATLQRVLKDTLTGKKILLVMDDVWNNIAWEDVLKTPLVNGATPGSRVLVTTRDERVARGMKAIPPYHHIDKLDADDAWSLLKKQVAASEMDESDIAALKDTGMEIVSKCDGLPLAVKVMGGLLRQKDRNHSDWGKVLNDSAWSVVGMPEGLNYVVYISYEDLSPCLKQCFLHYSLLPKNIVFGSNTIVGMWIGEGFVHGSSSDDLEELGRQYYKELILRNLIEPYNKTINQYHCIMHDVVRSFGQCMSQDEALVAHIHETSTISKLGSQKFIRLSIETGGSESDKLKWSMLQEQKHLRTLISAGQFEIKPNETLIYFSSLRNLHIQSANIAALVDHIYQLKHLRYLSVRDSDIFRLPDNIGEMKFLQLLDLRSCRNLKKLPSGIVKLGHLRYLNMNETSKDATIPRGFGALSNMRILFGFPGHVDDEWCSLEELGPLCELRKLGLNSLENVYDASSAEKARLCEKVHLTELILRCSSRTGDDGLVEEEAGVSEEEQRKIIGLFDELCPPHCLERLEIGGYFGRRLQRWMTSTSATALKSLNTLWIDDLTCCTQLPDGLCELPYLQFIHICHAPAIKHVGPEFMQLYHHCGHPPSKTMVSFPRLNKLDLKEMVQWEVWEWEEEVKAMPVLEEVQLKHCKLRCLPPGLSYHARALRKLSLESIQHLTSLENFASIVDLEVSQNPDLERITDLPVLQKLTIIMCPKMKVLEGVPLLQNLFLEDYGMEALPEYMRGVNPRQLNLDCSIALLRSIAAGQSGPEWAKFSHVGRVKGYAREGDNKRKWYVMYTREPYNLETDIDY